jgi:hypothetical protein
MDTKDIIQGQHFTAEQEDAAEPSDPNAFGSVLLEEPDFLSEGGEGLAERASHTLFMMRKPRNVASLDNFVITNHDLSSNELRIIPMKINIDLKSADLRVKGLKTKIKKANNQ